MSKKWSDRFDEPTSEIVKKYSASVGFDSRLAMVDIQGSMAHVQMLKKQKIITNKDYILIMKGLKQIQKEINKDQFKWSIDHEDVHLNIENRLISIVGEAGKKLHTGRSRNDQVATDMRLWLREIIDQHLITLKKCQKNIISLAEKHIDTIMPGFTHLQVAQPVSFAHHLMAYFEMFQRDKSRLIDVRKRTNQLPLGSAALAGTSFPIDRKYVAKLLKFDSVMLNSIDAVADRDFLIEYNACASLIMIHLSRFSEELILWSTDYFDFVEISDGFCTGSSIMPQKKNPDIPELIRGKVGRVNGHLVSLLTLMKAQPLAYNKDNQEDKEPIFDVADTLVDTLTIFAAMIQKLSIKSSNMEQAALKGYATATDLADYLVKKGLAFRQAHSIVAKVVKFAIKKESDLSDLTLIELQKFSKSIDQDVFKFLTLKGSLNSRKHVGGTSPGAVKKTIQKAKQLI